jgi:hypothetical protein
MAYTPKNANGQATMANSSPVVVASDQTKIKVDLTETTANSVAIKVDGSAVTQPISAASLPLPSTAATSTKQSDGSQKTQVVDGSGNVIGATSNALDINIKSGNPTSIAVTQATASNLNAQVAGDVASGATDSGNPVKIGGKYNATMPTLTDGQRGDAQLTTRGAVKTTLFANDSNTTIRVFADNADGVATTSTGNGLGVVNRNTVYNGTTWDRQYGDSTNGTWVNVKSTVAPVLAAGTNIVGKVGIDQTTNGTTNNVTNRDVTYNKLKCDAGTLVANTAVTASLTITGAVTTAIELEITNISGASTIYYTLDNSTPSSTNFSGILPATPSSVVLPCSGTPTLKLISAGTPTWGAVVRGV